MGAQLRLTSLAERAGLTADQVEQSLAYAELEDGRLRFVFKPQAQGARFEESIEYSGDVVGLEDAGFSKYVGPSIGSSATYFTNDRCTGTERRDNDGLVLVRLGTGETIIADEQNLG